MKTSSHTKCPACNHGRHEEVRMAQLYKCLACDCLHGRLYKGESYSYVKPWFSTDPSADERAKPFDLEVLGSEGIERRHGWYDPTTGLITQVG